MKHILIFLLFFYCSRSFTGTVSLEWESYFSPPPLKNVQTQDYTFFKWEDKNSFEIKPFQWDYHLKIENSLGGIRMIYFGIPELSLSYRYDIGTSLYSVQSIELGFGRKIKNWSIADTYWNMGLWNSLIRWNPIHPEEQGLTGAFLTLRSTNWVFTSLLGALYLPNQERQMLSKDGQFYSHSRWFSPLPSKVDILGQDYLDIYYSTSRPFLFEILFQPSYLTSFKIWNSTGNFLYWMKWSVADKPVNHLYHILNKKNLFKLSDQAGEKGTVNQSFTIIPVRQRLLSAEWGSDYKKYSFIFTVENAKMKEENLSPIGWGFLNMREHFTYFSVLLRYNLSPKQFVQAGYLQSWFHNYNPYLERTGESQPSLLQKYMFLKGLSFDWKTEMHSPEGLKRLFVLNYRWSFVSEGAWLFAKFLYYVTPKVYTSVSLNILGAEGNAGFLLNKFRHNDYFSWSWNYVF